MPLLLLLALGCVEPPAPVQPDVSTAAPAPPNQPVRAASVPSVETAPRTDSLDEVFLVPAKDGWIVLGCLDANAKAERAQDCRSRLPKQPLVALAEGGTLQLTEALPVHCPTSDQALPGLGPVPDLMPSPIAWWPPRADPFWLTGSRSELRKDRVPETRQAALAHFRSQGHKAKANQVEVLRVSRSDLDHDGREDLIVEVTIPPTDPANPRPSALFRIEDSVSLLTAKGLKTAVRTELAGAWDAGQGSALLLLQSHQVNGMGSHLIGFEDGEPILLGQWFCGS